MWRGCDCSCLPADHQLLPPTSRQGRPHLCIDLLTAILFLDRTPCLDGPSCSFLTVTSSTLRKPSPRPQVSTRSLTSRGQSHSLGVAIKPCRGTAEVRCGKLSTWQARNRAQYQPEGTITHYHTHTGVCTVRSDLGQVPVPSWPLTAPSSGDTSPLQSLMCHRSQLCSKDPGLEPWPHLLPVRSSLLPGVW